jgi:nucleotide-binding universal stress UspA family protein
MFKKLIVAVDFSELSLRAAQVAASLARAIGAQVVLVHVVNPSADYGAIGLPSDGIRPGIEGKLKEIIGTLGATNCDWGVVDGDAATELSAFASRWSGDLIVIGTHGRTGLNRMLLGSVTTRLVREANVPVLVIGPEHRVS